MQFSFAADLFFVLVFHLHAQIVCIGSQSASSCGYTHFTVVSSEVPIFTIRQSCSQATQPAKGVTTETAFAISPIISPIIIFGALVHSFRTEGSKRRWHLHLWHWREWVSFSLGVWVDHRGQHPIYGPVEALAIISSTHWALLCTLVSGCTSTVHQHHIVHLHVLAHAFQGTGTAWLPQTTDSFASSCKLNVA